MKKISTAFIVAVILFTGCAITQEYHFNNDFSGTASTTIDLKQMIQFMKSVDTTGKADSGIDSIEQSLEKVAEKLKETGVTNIKYGWNDDKTEMSLSYDFKDIDVLNETLSKTGSGSELFGGGDVFSDSDGKKEFPKFTVKGKKKLIYDAPEIKNDSIFNNEQMVSMKDYYKYSLVFSFDYIIVVEIFFVFVFF